MAKTVHLNGGPAHDKTVSLEDDTDHFHIREADHEAIRRYLQTNVSEEGFQEVKIRIGTYSVVSGKPAEFEWDGWVSHD